MTETRVGVFVCHCGSNIGGVIDVPAVVAYAKTLPGVAHAEENLYTCSEGSLTSIQKKIKEHNLNRVVVAACTPRTHEPLFKNTCEEAGLNRYLFEFVNIREHCSWIHMNEHDAATEKAKELIRLGVAKVKWLEPQTEFEGKVIPISMVLGGGIAGMTAALNLANQGFEVHLVEKEAELGGLLKGVNRLFPTNQEADKLIEPIIQNVKSHKNIKLHMPATVKDVKGYIGAFTITVDQNGKLSEFNTGTIIVATGAQELKPEGFYNYGKMQNVLTQLELEGKLKKGTKWVEDMKGISIINCVGCRIAERTYCSRFCCVTAIKNAWLLKQANPAAKVFVLHRDMMAYGEFEEYYRKAMEAGVIFLRYNTDNPPEIVGDKKPEKIRIHDELTGKKIEVPCNMVVLTTPLISNLDNEVVSKLLKVPLGDGRFFLEAHLKLRPVEFATDGIYIAGSARWPADIRESVSQGYAAASKAGIPMINGSVKVEAITSYVNSDVCVGCGTCILACPYSAIELRDYNGVNKAYVREAMCKGCGTCVAACPNGAVQQKGCTNQQILSMINSLVGRK
ncbi:MAG: CoB--CoM heterodisulfide reductase iron-sulfur subunit A family protein [Chloroflexi bacterium]|nr:CoB--CoM heterodisulfide reductase iron-sulfur subunit A family protein [Chloroflexota bacterium]